MGKNVTREVKDKRNNTVYHFAAVTTKNIIEVSEESGKYMRIIYFPIFHPTPIAIADSQSRGHSRLSRSERV